MQYKVTDGEGSHGKHGDGGVSLDPGMLPGAQKEDRRDYGDGHNQQRTVGKLEYRGDRQSAEGDMG